MEVVQAWKNCGTCKKPIGFGARYFVCSVSTCNRARTGMIFCSVPCWDAHVPMMNHKENAGAIEEKAPARDQWIRMQREAALEASKEKKMSEEENLDEEIMVVASKVKAYIRAKSGLNTSGNVLAKLSSKVRYLCNEAIEAAKDDGRKTVMDRDFK